MLYLVTPHNDRVRAHIDGGTLGTFVTPGRMSGPLPTGPWAGDNGAFSGFDERKFVTLLDKFKSCASRCLFVAVPDVVADWAATVQLYGAWNGRIAAYGYPRALVIQDGATVETIPWDDLEAIFVGGTTDWKLGGEAATIVGEAKRRGKHAHMGRVNSYRRLAYAREIGCDTADGTFLKFAPDVNLPRLERWLERLDAHEQYAFDF